VAQIVILLKVIPETRAAAPYVELDGRVPPFFFTEAHVVGAEHPVGLQVVDDVVVAGNRDELLVGSSYGLLDGEAADLGDFTVHDAGELVEYDDGLVQEDGSGDVDPHLLSLAQLLVALQPVRWAAEADAAQGPRYVRRGQVLGEVVEDAGLLVGEASDVGVWE